MWKIGHKAGRSHQLASCGKSLSLISFDQLEFNSEFCGVKLNNLPRNKKQLVYFCYVSSSAFFSVWIFSLISLCCCSATYGNLVELPK